MTLTSDQTDAMPKQTPLYDLHIELNAKMVPYANYLMPLHYGKGALHEHRHCRSQAGFFDISHMGQCMILGDSAIHEIEKLTPSALSGLEIGQQKYSVLTLPNGGVIDDIIVTRIDSGISIIVNAACKEKDFSHIKSRISEHCNFIELADSALLALQGPASASIMQKFSKEASALCFMHSLETEIEGIRCSVSRSGYTGEDGFEISLDSVHAEKIARLMLAEESVEPIGLAARDSLRLEAGLCLYGHELNETITPVEAGLSWLISKDPGQFPGADIILAQLQKGPDKIRRGLWVEGKIPVRDGAELFDGEGLLVGHVSSGGFSPSLNQPIALAFIDRRVAEIGNALYATVRDHRIALQVARLPFVPHRYLR